MNLDLILKNPCYLSQSVFHFFDLSVQIRQIRVIRVPFLASYSL